MNLNEMYIELDDTVAEQNHYVLHFLFEDEGDDKVYEYALEFESGMHLDDFKEFIKLFSTVIKNTNPSLCEENYG